MHPTGLRLPVGLLLSLFWSVPALAENPHLREGIRLLDRAEDEPALAAFHKALGWKQSTPEEISRIHMYLGITYFDLIRQDEAGRHFRAAFEREPNLKLPQDLSPKTTQFAESIRATVRHGSNPGVAEAASRPSPALVTSPMPPCRRPVNWPAWTLAGLAVASAATAMGLGLVAQSHAAEANDLKLSSAEAEAKHDAAHDEALAANVMVGVAAGTALTSALLFIFGKKRAQACWAGVVPTQRGMVVQLSGALSE